MPPSVLSPCLQPSFPFPISSQQSTTPSHPAHIPPHLSSYRSPSPTPSLLLLLLFTLPQVLELSELPFFPDQVFTLTRTGVLAGVHGAGLTNMLFMEPGKGAVVEVWHGMEDNFHYGEEHNGCWGANGRTGVWVMGRRISARNGQGWWVLGSWVQGVDGYLSIGLWSESKSKEAFLALLWREGVIPHGCITFRSISSPTCIAGISRSIHDNTYVYRLHLLGCAWQAHAPVGLCGYPNPCKSPAMLHAHAPTYGQLLSTGKHGMLACCRIPAACSPPNCPVGFPCRSAANLAAALGHSYHNIKSSEQLPVEEIVTATEAAMDAVASRQRQGWPARRRGPGLLDRWMPG